MKRVFIGGSRKIGSMNFELAQRLDNIIRKRLGVLVGDANGFDRVAQAYFAEHAYSNVEVYCTAGECRNNVGAWPLHTVEYAGRDRGLAFYTAKDDAMIQDADYGLFAWDCKSKGTLRNIRLMAERGKASAVYVFPWKKFVTIHNSTDALSLTQDEQVGTVETHNLFIDNESENTRKVRLG